MMTQTAKQPYILMVENDEDDQFISKEYFRENDIPAILLDTAEEMFGFLESRRSNPCELPSLILLDYHLLPLNATQIISLIRRTPAYAHIPVVVLSGSKSEDMVRECYRSGANSFIQKPALVSETDQKIASFLSYWFKTAELI